ncbi:MAG: DGQHR domain-containing protein [Candidatus Lokiarchaeota archaeon]|nr:DGQHR domain-containing protein [Candidatus Lokiarchaeota archaeon]
MKIKALKFNQKTKDIYVFAANPHYILQMVKIKSNSGGDEYFQRPYDEKRVEEIKHYVLGKDKLFKKGKDITATGYIPNAIVINLDSKFKLDENSGDYFISFPEKNKIKGYKNAIEIIDGQHRLLAFDNDVSEKLGKDSYQITFVAFFNLTMDEKREIFMVLNERQKSVSKNILLRHKKLLNLLLDEDETRYEVLSRLNADKDSPFFEKLIVGGEKIKYGIKIVEFDRDLNNSKALDDLIKSNGQLRTDGNKLIKNYFNAWRKVFSEIWFVNNNTITKMAGIRFMCHLFPSLYDVLRNQGNDFRIEKFVKLIKDIKSDYFDDKFNLKIEQYSKSFLERGETIKLAKAIGKAVKDKYILEEEDIVV